MATILAFVVGAVFAAGLYTMLQRSIVKMVIGLSLISHAVNLLVFTSGGLLVGHPPLIPAGAHALPGPFTDPVPQALVLTAIVISFGVLAFAVVLILRAYQSVGTDDLDELTRTDT